MKAYFKKKSLSAIVIGLLIVLALNLFEKETRSFFYSVSSPFQKTLWQAGYNSSSFIAGLFNAEDARKETELLRLENQRLLAENISLKEVAEENVVLREALELGLQEEFRLIMAEVSGKMIGQDTIILNKGAEDGVAKDMPVITQEKVLFGLIGTLYENFAEVNLVSNKKSSFSAKIADSNVIGVIKGQGSFEASFEFIPRDQKIEEGNLVVTSALAGGYPEGFLVGLLEKIERNPAEPFQKAKLSLFLEEIGARKLFIIAE